MRNNINLFLKNNVGNKDKLQTILENQEKDIAVTDNESEYLQECKIKMESLCVEQINKLYNENLFRNPSKFDIEYWVKKIFDEQLGFEFLENILINSEEYLKLGNVRNFYEKLQSEEKSDKDKISELSVNEIDEKANISLFSNPRGKTSNTYHKFSIHITKFFLKVGISANVVTVMATILAVLGSIFIGTTNFSLVILGIFLIEFHFMLDIVDGEIARLNLSPKPSGTYLDLISHFIASPIIWMGFTIGLFNINQDIWAIIIGMTLVVGTVMKLADYVLHFGTIPITIFWKSKLVKYKTDKRPRPLKSERILEIIEKYCVLGQPGTFHVVVICSIGLILINSFEIIYTILVIFLVTYSILLNFSWILSVYGKITNQTIERQFKTE